MENQQQQQEPKRQKLEYSLDQFEFDYLIVGTGLTESLYCSHMQKVNEKSCLIIDQDDQYSSSIRTLNFKEFHTFCTNLNPNQAIKTEQPEQPEQTEQNQENNEENAPEDSEKQNEQTQQEQENENNVKEEDIQYDQGKLKKQFQFFPAYISKESSQKNYTFQEEIFSNPQNPFRRYNIDLQPKVLFSTSLTVDMMQQANMDQYMEFKAIQGIYHYDNKKKKFIQAPSGKSDIFKHKDLGLKEKKDMFNILHKCIKLYYQSMNYEFDQNSIDEFDKDFKIDEQTKQNYEKYKDEVCTVFLKSLNCSEKVMEIFMYTICNFEVNVLEWENSYFKNTIKKECTTQKFLGQVAKFIKSCGVHTRLPYLYTSYGTGDIPQGFSRICAVFGGQFIINDKIAVYDINFNQQEHNLQIDTNLIDNTKQEEKKILKVKEGIIVGQEFRNSFETSFLKNIPEFSSQIQENKPENSTVDLHLLRVNYICQKKQEEGEFNYDYPSPLIFYIPPHNELLKNEHPIQVFQFDYDTHNTPRGYYLFQAKTVINNELLSENNTSKQDSKLAQYIDKIGQFMENITIYSEKGFKVLYTGSFLQHRTVDIISKENDNNNFFQITTKQETKKEQDKEQEQEEQDEKVKEQQFKLLFTEQENFEIDMDRNYDEFKNTLGKLSGKFDEDELNFFMTIKELKGENQFNNNEEVDSEEDQDGITKLINQFDKLKDQDKKEQVPPKKQENDTQQQQNQESNSGEQNQEQEQEKEQQNEDNIEYNYNEEQQQQQQEQKKEQENDQQ